MKLKSKIFVGILAVVSSFSSCDYQEKFDKATWNAVTDPAFPPPSREKMLDDLIKNHKLIGLNYSQLIDSLGEPNYEEDSLIGYRIKEDYGSDIDPVYTKTLQFFISKDSIVTSFKVNEWKKE